MMRIAIIVILFFPIVLFAVEKSLETEIDVFEKYNRHFSGIVKKCQDSLVSLDKAHCEYYHYPGKYFISRSYRYRASTYDDVVKVYNDRKDSYDKKERPQKIIEDIAKMMDVKNKKEEKFKSWFDSIDQESKKQIVAQYLARVKKIVDLNNKLREKMDDRKLAISIFLDESEPAKSPSVINFYLNQKSNLSAQLVMVSMLFETACENMSVKGRFSSTELISVFSNDEGEFNLTFLFDVVMGIPIGERWMGSMPGERYLLEIHFEKTINTDMQMSWQQVESKFVAVERCFENKKPYPSWWY